MMRGLEQFMGGTLLSNESNAGVSAVPTESQTEAQNHGTSSLLLVPEPPSVESGVLSGGNLGASYTCNCATLPARGRIGERGGSLARRRYQKGSVFLRGKKDQVWVGRWREDVEENGHVRREYRSEVLGSKSDYPTKRLALRELEKRLGVVNDPRYRARPTATFADFASRWESLVLTQHKPSTQVTIRSHLRKHLVPYFGRWQMREIELENVQRFVSSVKASAKTAKNLFATMQMLWKSARAWSYVAHDVVSGVVLPKRCRAVRRFFSLDEMQRILEAAPEPLRTFYWLAVETGMRAGELCGLQMSDFDLKRGVVSIRRSVWQGKLQSPKSENAIRVLALSPGIVAHIVDVQRRWTPNERGLLFATRNGTPWDANLLLKRKLYPLLDSLKIERGGLHAFRHANSTLMDRMNVPMKVRQQRLGHSDSSLTLDVYTHTVGEDDVRVAGQLDGILHPLAPKNEKLELALPANSSLIN